MHLYVKRMVLTQSDVFCYDYGVVILSLSLPIKQYTKLHTMIANMDSFLKQTLERSKQRNSSEYTSLLLSSIIYRHLYPNSNSN
jgi:hypothetical protein